jgi:hypothetical protein
VLKRRFGIPGRNRAETRVSPRASWRICLERWSKLLRWQWSERRQRREQKRSRRRARSGTCRKTLKGNKAHGSNGRDVASNGGDSQRTYQWSKALKTAFAGETRQRTRPGNGVGEQSRGVRRVQARSAAVEASARFGASRWKRQFDVGTSGGQRPLVNIGLEDFGSQGRW